MTILPSDTFDSSDNVYYDFVESINYSDDILILNYDSTNGTFKQLDQLFLQADSVVENGYDVYFFNTASYDDLYFKIDSSILYMDLNASYEATLGRFIDEKWESSGISHIFNDSLELSNDDLVVTVSELLASDFQTSVDLSQIITFGYSVIKLTINLSYIEPEPEPEPEEDSGENTDIFVLKLSAWDNTDNYTERSINIGNYDESLANSFVESYDNDILTYEEQQQNEAHILIFKKDSGSGVTYIHNNDFNINFNRLGFTYSETFYVYPKPGQSGESELRIKLPDNYSVNNEFLPLVRISVGMFNNDNPTNWISADHKGDPNDWISSNYLGFLSNINADPLIVYDEYHITDEVFISSNEITVYPINNISFIRYINKIFKIELYRT